MSEPIRRTAQRPRTQRTPAPAHDGSFSSPAQHLSGFPLAKFAEANGSLSFQVRGSDRGERVFTGSFSEDGQKFSGTFSQLGYDLPFELVRSGDPRKETRVTSPAVAKTVEGQWKAVIESGATLTLTIANQPDGTAQATLVQTGEGLAIPVSQIKLSSSTLKLDLPAIGGVFVGEVAKDGTQIAGNYTGPDSTVQVTFRRADSGDAR